MAHFMYQTPYHQHTLTPWVKPRLDFTRGHLLAFLLSLPFPASSLPYRCLLKRPLPIDHVDLNPWLRLCFQGIWPDLRHPPCLNRAVRCSSVTITCLGFGTRKVQVCFLALPLTNYVHLLLNLLKSQFLYQQNGHNKGKKIKERGFVKCTSYNKYLRNFSYFYYFQEMNIIMSI